MKFYLGMKVFLGYGYVYTHIKRVLVLGNFVPIQFFLLLL